MTNSAWSRRIFLFLLLCVPLVPAARAQSGAARSSFFDYLKAQAEKTGNLYLIEGEPARTIVAEPTQSDGKNAKEAVSLQDMATRYGYRAETLPSGIVIFHKTYYDEYDLPSVTLEEWVAASRDIAAIVSAVSPHLDPSTDTGHPIADSILQTFSASQLAALQRGKTEIETRGKNAPPMTDKTAQESGLPVARLNAAQKAGVWQAARFIYVQNSLRDTERTFAALLVLTGENQTQTNFVFDQVNGLRLFGYTTKTRDKAAFVALSKPYQFVTRLDGGTYPHLNDKKDFLVPPTSDPTDPVQKNDAAVPAALPAALSLKELVERLNAEKTADKPLFVSDILAAKRVSVAGNLSRKTPLDVIRAVSTVFGLRVVNAADQITLTRPRARITSDPAQTRSAIDAVLPLPFLNAYTRTIRTDDPASQAVPLPGGGSIKTEAVSVGVRWAALRRLRTTVEQKINASPHHLVPLADLDAPEKEAFATVLMSYCIKSLAEFTKKPVPLYITDFNQTVLTGALERGRDNKQWLTLFMGRRLANGTLVQEGGFSSATDLP